jgi:hypothetical protein
MAVTERELEARICWICWTIFRRSTNSWHQLRAVRVAKQLCLYSEYGVATRERLLLLLEKLPKSGPCFEPRKRRRL